MSTTDTRAAYEAWINTDEAMGSTSITWDTWKAALTWQAATEAAKATGTAGELPPLPDFPAHARLYTTGLGRRTYRRAATTPGEGAPLVLVSEAKAIAREYGQACAEAARHDADAAKRLRLICKLVGIESHVPADDQTLWGAAFAVLGQVRAALEAARQPAPVMAVKTWKQRLEDLGVDIGDGIDMDHLIIKAMKTEIADLRAALAVRSQP